MPLPDNEERVGPRNVYRWLPNSVKKNNGSTTHSKIFLGLLQASLSDGQVTLDFTALCRRKKKFSQRVIHVPKQSVKNFKAPQKESIIFDDNYRVCFKACVVDFYFFSNPVFCRRNSSIFSLRLKKKCSIFGHTLKLSRKLRLSEIF